MKQKMSKYEKRELSLAIVRLALIVAAIALLIWVNAYFAFIILAIGLWVGIDLIMGVAKKSCPVLPQRDQKKHRHKYHINDILWLLENPTLKNNEMEAKSMGR